MVPSMHIMSGASRPIAANAALRPDQMRVRCFSSVASTVVPPHWRDDVGDARHRMGDIGFDAVGVDDQDGLGAGG